MKTWLVAFVCVVTAVWLIRPLAIRIGLVDKPGGRKIHEGEIPLIGGVCLFIGFMFAALMLQISLSEYRSFIAASGLLVFVGILDDFHELTPRARLLSQILAAVLMALWGKNVISHVGNLFLLGDIHLGMWATPVTIMAVVGIINAVNMTDGIDGLAATLAFIQFAFLTFLAYYTANMNALHLLCVLMAALLGFLVFNFRFHKRPQVHIFMGDAGSMFIGFSLSWFLVSLSQEPSTSLIRPVTMLWIMAVPLFDILRLMIKRTLERRSPFHGGRDHIHHSLEDYGFTPMQISLCLGGATIVLGGLGILGSLWFVPDSILFLTFLLLFISYYKCLEKLAK